MAYPYAARGRRDKGFGPVLGERRAGPVDGGGFVVCGGAPRESRAGTAFPFVHGPFRPFTENELRPVRDPE